MSELMEHRPPVENHEMVKVIVDKQVIEVPAEDRWLYSADTMRVTFDKGDDDE